MKAFLGLIQLACGAWGLIAIFNGNWPFAIGAWLVALLVGFAGSRLVRSSSGISELGHQSSGDISRAIELLRQGQFSAASGVTRGAVFSFRAGGDRGLLTIALTVHAVALAATHDIAGARKALIEADNLYDTMPPHFALEVAELREVHAMVQRELSTGVSDPSLLVSRFLEANDAV